MTALKPRVLTFDKDNRIVDRLTSWVERDAEGGYSFSILTKPTTFCPFRRW
ncbi:hypothetical protein LB553_29910 [Mesorhizobium sp. CA8]|uniref:hypothetical protein n=1 Tax=unclassified Mesorhizobium TaxID=325217 RepID=UPI001CCE2351|nr:MULTISPECIES: hypothetical protein [unclassified Mesorhizobium]MBZ9765048.1 hypothetical protein [Mesorhizobium sp. CA8]MBZ9823531.1 hypothetical protein [Mesorhizobium sp. CA4]